MKKEQLLKEFIEDKLITSKIKKDYKKIIDYYDALNGYGKDRAMIINDFIELNYFQLTYDDGLNKKRMMEWMKEIKSYTINDYISELINIDDDIILDSYLAFQKYVNAADDDFDNLAIIRDAQYNGILALFREIRLEFIEFLRGKTWRILSKYQ